MSNSSTASSAARSVSDSWFAEARRLIAAHRDRVGLDPIWQLRVEPLVADDRLAEIRWSAVWSAVISVTPAVQGPLLEWLVVHELFELLDAEGAEFDEELIAELDERRQPLLFKRQHDIRDRRIEKTVRAYLGCDRPCFV